MDKHYYLISQLPWLYFDKETGMRIEDFLQEARKWLSGREYVMLSVVELGDVSLDEKSPRVLQEYKELEFRVGNDLALWRRARLADQEYKPMTFPASLVKEGNPLEVEKKLLKLRWDFIEEKEREHHFDLGFVMLYFLKLQILRRLAAFDKEKGLVTFKKLCEVEV